MTAALATAMGWTQSGTAVPTPAPGEPTPEGSAALLALLDLYEATGESAYIDAAVNLGRSLVGECEHEGMLASDPAAAGAASSDNILALALLHCAAALEGCRGELPPYYPGGSPWDPKVVVRTVLGKKA